MGNHEINKTWKQKLFYEFREYLINFAYMSLVFSAIILYRRLVLAQHGIMLDDYFLGVFKALVIAKVVMIGAFLSISRKFEHKPLIVPIVYKAFIFTILVMIFDIIEEFIRGLIHCGVLMEAITDLQSHLSIVWLGGALLIFFTFIPFFALKELIRIEGKERIQNLFFKKRIE